MTIAIALKVGDGVVLGTDSATTFVAPDGSVSNVFFNAEKMVNLVKGWPIGIVTYGLGNLSGRSISSLAKDLRRRLSGEDSLHRDWALNEASYTIVDVANRVRDFFYTEHYEVAFKGLIGQPFPSEEERRKNPRPYAPGLGFLVAGFGAEAPHAEVYAVEIAEGGLCSAPQIVCPQVESRVMWRGMGDALHRLILGFSAGRAAKLMAEANISREDANAALMDQAPLLNPAMPIQDAIDLVRYMADVTVGYVRFAPGAASVAPPIDVAAITKHEGFRWVSRKHYYSTALNLPPSVVDIVGSRSVVSTGEG
jgi:hypothetical protein